jgi:sugar phosphate isomerase/epimerase
MRQMATDFSMLTTRREFCGQMVAGSVVAASYGLRPALAGDAPQGGQFALRYILGSAMYGTVPLAEVLGEAKTIGASAIDIWPQQHANHREQLDELGHDRVEELLQEHGVQLGVITRYDLGPYRLQKEMPLLRRFGGKLLVCGAHQQPGDTLKKKVRQFVESMKAHIDHAERYDLTIGIENHSGNLLETPDSIRYFADAIDSPRLGLALAPYHLPQDPELIAALIEHLDDKLVFFQAWQYGKGCHEKLPKEEELLQMPGRGPLDFTPLLAALKRIDYQGWTEVFMHPVPRGIAIRDTSAEVTEEINRSRAYLERRLEDINEV